MLEIYSSMSKIGVLLDSFRFHLVLRTCSLNSLIREGKAVHGSAIKTGFGLNSYVETALISMYGRFGQIDNARKVFDEMPNRDLLSWSSMMFAYKQSQQPEFVLRLYQKMKQYGVCEDSVILVNVASGIAHFRSVIVARIVHGVAVKKGFDSDLYVESAMVNMYAKCGQTDFARRIFDEMKIKDLVCWTSMITAYEQAEQPKEALVLFQMMQSKGLFADSVSLVSVASAVGLLGDSVKAESILSFAISNGFLRDVSVGNALISMYTKCGDTEKARLVFDRMVVRDVISWNSMLSGYTENRQFAESFAFYDEMSDCGLEPNSVTALIMVSAFGFLGSLQLGVKFHDFISSSNIKIDVSLGNALMDMYVKCGDLESATDMFNQIHPSKRDVMSWNILISGYGMYGEAKKALELFSQMKEAGIKPDHISFVSVLSTCSHGGLVDEGRFCFSEMKKFNVTPEAKHYACVVDMLGRAGFSNEAYDLIMEMPMQPDDSVWGSLLLACRVHGNRKLAVVVASRLLKLVPEHSGCYVLLSNINAEENRWEDVRVLRQEISNHRLKKPTAFSAIEG